MLDRSINRLFIDYIVLAEIISQYQTEQNSHLP